MIQEFKQSGGIKLVVLDDRLFRGARCFRSLRFRHTQSISEIRVHSIVGLPVSLGWFNPMDEPCTTTLQCMDRYWIIYQDMQPWLVIQCGAFSKYTRSCSTDLLFLSEVFSLKMVDTACGYVQSKVLELRLTQPFHLFRQLSSLMKQYIHQ